MSRLRKISVAAGTFAVALGIGFVMQNGDAMAARFGSELPEGYEQPAETLDTALGTITFSRLETGAALPPAPLAPTEASVEFPAEVDTPEMPTAPVELAGLETDLAPTADETAEGAPDEAAAAPDCGTTLSAEAGPGALVALTLTSPCMPAAQATIHHQGMMFSLVTDDAGTARAVVPALSEMAVFIASFDRGEGAVTSLAVPEVAEFDRAVLQWQGDAGLEVHALEFGALYGDDGHVWNAAARSAEVGESGEGGFLVRLGDASASEPFMAEVYSYPTGLAHRDGQVQLSVEAEVTEANCGTEVAAQAIQVHPGADTDARDLTMTMPDCDAVGDFLVLKNLLSDLTLTAR